MENTKNKFFTLKDIAKKAGVSYSTVSRVVNNENYVKEITKIKIDKILKEFHYHPEWTARSLRKGRTKIIGLIIPNIANIFFGSVGLSIQNILREKNIDLILFNTNNDPGLEKKSLEIALSKRVEGIILASIIGSEELVEQIIERYNIPIVLMDNKLNNLKVDVVLHDNVEAAKLLVEHLIGHGHKKVACITGPIKESSAFERVEGYKKALSKNKIPMKDNLVKFTNWTKEKAYKATEELLLMNPKDRPTAFFTTNTNMAIGVIKCFDDNNFVIPKDVALVTFDDYDFASILKPPLTTLKKVDSKLGAIAINLLLEKIEKCVANYGKEIRVKMELEIRKSCGCN
jgi:LacI family transcriptional regulator